MPCGVGGVPTGAGLDGGVEEGVREGLAWLGDGGQGGRASFKKSHFSSFCTR